MMPWMGSPDCDTSPIKCEAIVHRASLLVGGNARKHNSLIVATSAQAARVPGDLANRFIAHAPAWITGLLIVLFSTRAALLVADLAGPPVAVGRQAALPTSSSRKVVDLPSILRANLFGQSAAPTGTDAPVTSMNLKLVSVFAESDEKRGLAALGPSLSDIKVYKVGDAVPGGALLHAVYLDRVLLDRGGVIEALLMPPLIGAGQATPAVSPMASNPAASVERVQQVIQNNPGLITEVIQRQAVFENGRLRGMRVNPGRNAPAFAKLGLRPNDIVTAINGTPLDDQAHSNEVFNTLSGSAEARVTVLRNGREQELTLNLAEIANEAEKLADAPPTPSPEPDPGPDSTR
jgi:general secretion pathway protein C